jgi:hypothetical protein
MIVLHDDLQPLLSNSESMIDYKCDEFRAFFMNSLLPTALEAVLGMVGLSESKSQPQVSEHISFSSNYNPTTLH